MFLINNMHFTPLTLHFVGFCSGKQNICYYIISKGKYTEREVIKMFDINIDPYRVRKAAAELRDCTSQLREKTRTFNDIEDEIEASWKSRYTRTYLNCLEDTEGNVMRTVDNIDLIADNLDKIAQAVENAEADIQSKLSGGGGGGSW